MWCSGIPKGTWYSKIPVWGRFYLSLRSAVLYKTSYHVNDSWHFPIFLLSYGSLPLVNMAFLKVLAKLCDTLPILPRLFTLLGWPVVLGWSEMEEGTLRCSLNLSPGSCRFTKVTLITPYFSHLIPVNHTSFWCDSVCPWESSARMALPSSMVFAWHPICYIWCTSLVPSTALEILLSITSSTDLDHSCIVKQHWCFDFRYWENRNISNSYPRINFRESVWLSWRILYVLTTKFSSRFDLLFIGV